MTCHSCFHCRQAGNKELVGCKYWTEIFHGNKSALRSALAHINKKESFGINLDSHILEKEAIEFLIDVLIEDYAPKPMYEGWANLNSLPKHDENIGGMTDSCVVLNPQGCCDFYEYQLSDLKKSPEVREPAQTN